MNLLFDSDTTLNWFMVTQALMEVRLLIFVIKDQTHLPNCVNVGYVH